VQVNLHLKEVSANLFEGTANRAHNFTFRCFGVTDGNITMSPIFQ
jgi:hypothetical protein